MISTITPFLENINLIDLLTHQGSQSSERDSVYIQKHQLKCDTCYWTTSYTDANGFLNISGTNIQCPVCKKGLVKINEYDNDVNEKYIYPPYLSYVLADW